MEQKKVTRYYAEGCKKGFWKKKDCLLHEKQCKCWTNPKNKTCKTCAYGERQKDYEDHGPLGREDWDYWECHNEHCDAHSGAPKNIDYISVNCIHWEPE